jgi:heavy metal sensor kinase
VLVGRSVRRVEGQLAWLAGQLALTGLAVLAVGLVGGFVLSGRAVRPIAAMSSTAAAISASNLNRRIDVKGVDSELGTLAAVLNEMFARLEAAFERQARFTADASHELRTPLSIIQSHAELALSRPRAAAEYQDALDACARASKRMKAIVEGLLTLARADGGKLELRRQPLDLGALVTDAASLLAPLAAEKGVALSVEAPPLAAAGDVTRLTQVVTNLTTNAINYNHPGGRVAVTLAAEGGEAVLSVADDGCGIPEEDRPHIFERFYRVDKARSRELGGSGLGLAICKSIVEGLGGTIGFTTEVNRGTTFVVRLPLGAGTTHFAGPPADGDAPPVHTQCQTRYDAE